MTGRDDVFASAMKEGHSAAWEQDWNRAADFYKTALQEFPDNPKALNSFAQALFESDRLEESLQVYEQAARSSPADPFPFERIALISETLGRSKTAVQAFMQAADLFNKNHNSARAIENWQQVTRIAPEYPQSHSNLALLYIRMGHKDQAVTEYLSLASILQHSGNITQAVELITRALQLMPGNPQALQAARFLKTGQMIPPPMPPGSSPQSLPQEPVIPSVAAPSTQTDLDPISTARQSALVRLAELLFEYNSEKEKSQQVRRGLNAIVRGTGPLQEIGGNSAILLHLGQAVDAQSRQDDSAAADEFEKVLDAGFTDPALFFDLGLLRAQGTRLESALRYLGHSVGHADYALGARLLMGKTLFKMGRLNEASIEYLEALKLADVQAVPTEQADVIQQKYESLIEAQSSQTDPADNEKLCNFIEDMLNRPNWHSQVSAGRAQLSGEGGDSGAVPLAEILTQTRSSRVIEAMENIHKLASAGQFRSAMEEAYHSIQFAPTYLPLHLLISDLLVQDENVTDAVTKLSVVARTYAVRGETKQASRVLKQLIQLSPLDLSARNLLIDQLIARGEVEPALSEYIDLAGLYYRQADLDNAYKVYKEALRLCTESHVPGDWKVRILMNMADIDVQSLNWREACLLYQQARTIRPGDETLRRNIIDLHFRLGQTNQAYDEIIDFFAYLNTTGLRSTATPFLQALLEEHPQEVNLHRYLADEFHKSGNLNGAIEQLDALGKSYMDTGDTRATSQVIESIIALQPPNIDRYRAVLEKLKEGSGTG
jgi:tetratricopeptide (TPR) repeat protein